MNYPLIVLAVIGICCVPGLLYRLVRFLGSTALRLAAVDRLQTNYGKLQDRIWLQERKLENLTDALDVQFSKGKEQP